uniref:ATP synthase subunit b', chloroplastic n=1 Tax=Araucaria cunninghamii TaxID=56994 RepID=A0A0D6R2D8_ARACU
MASALMASPLKPIARLHLPRLYQSRAKLPTTNKPLSLLVQAHQHQKINKTNKIPTPAKPLISISISPAVRNGCLIAFNSLLAMPALAEIEKAKLFDFNLTLPIVMVEFLLLMVALDKVWFQPLGKFMDDRDENIRQQLMSVRDNSDEIKRLQEEADAILKAARAEVTAALNQMKKEMSAELEQKLKESKERVEKELELALQKLDAQKQETLQSLDRQIEELSQEIVRKVLPFKI